MRIEKVWTHEDSSSDINGLGSHGLDVVELLDESLDVSSVTEVDLCRISLEDGLVVVVVGRVSILRESEEEQGE